MVIWLTAIGLSCGFTPGAEPWPDLLRQLSGSVVIAPLPYRDTHSTDVTNRDLLCSVLFDPEREQIISNTNPACELGLSEAKSLQRPPGVRTLAGPIVPPPVVPDREMARSEDLPRLPRRLRPFLGRVLARAWRKERC
jgi:hypothetical protein